MFSPSSKDLDKDEVEALAAWGLVPEDKDDGVEEIVLILPDNWEIFSVFEFMLTQWRVSGSGGATGLDYNVLPLAMEISEVASESRIETVQGVRVMEAVALNIMNEDREKIIQESKRKNNKR